MEPEVNLQIIEGELANVKCELASAQVQIARLLKAVFPPQVVKFTINIKGHKNMKAGLDFQLADNGTANATISFVDAAGLVTDLGASQTASVPTWTPSSPAVAVTVAPNGLSAAVAPAVPPVLATDVTITVSEITITNPDGSTIVLPAVTSEGIDVIGGPIVGFSIAL